MNDPNGFVYFDNQYHLFFQYNPYDTQWGPMHWGHCVSKDLIKWEMLPVALAPETDYDKSLGCFSGTGFSENGKLYLMYTGVIESEEKLVRQQQCLAESSDGINFRKYAENPVITTEQVPEGYNKYEFRDPKLFSRDGKYYCLVGTKREKGNDPCEGGEVLLYESMDMICWNFKSAIFNKAITKNGVIECPDIFELDGKDVIICSPQNIPFNDYKYQNTASSVYFIGKLDLKTGRYQCEAMDEIDAGFDFYAPQALKAPDGRIIMTAWMNMWGRSYPTEKDGWVGLDILPRELTIVDGRLRQNPVREIENYRSNIIEYSNCLIEEDGCVSFNNISGQSIELVLTVDLLDSEVFGIKLFASEKHETLLFYERSTGCITFDRSISGEKIEISPSENHYGDGVRKVKINLNNNRLTARIFLDKCSVEAFFQDGERVLTSTVYPDEEDINVYFYTTGGKALIKSLVKYDIL